MSFGSKIALTYVVGFIATLTVFIWAFRHEGRIPDHDDAVIIGCAAVAWPITGVIVGFWLLCGFISMACGGDFLQTWNC